MKPWIYDDDREIVTAQKPFQKGWTENMRKKSHISLARYIVANTEDEGLKKNKRNFCKYHWRFLKKQPATFRSSVSYK